MIRLLRILPVFALALATLLAAATGHASAKTFSHGLNVWFGDRTIGPYDVVEGDVNVVFGNVTCEPGGWVRGDVRIYGGNFDQLDGCRVDGEQIVLTDSMNSLLPWVTPPDSASTFFEENKRITSHLVYGVLILFAFLLFPVRVRIALERVERHPGLSAAAGTLAFVAVIPIAILLVLSIIGIPLVVVEVAALLAGLWIGQAAVAILIGRRLFELLRPHTTPSPLAALVLGLVVVGAAQLLPVFGWAVTALVALVGLGAAILAFVRESAFSGTVTPGPGAPPPGTTPMRSA
jgi:hypothetical protein